MLFKRLTGYTDYGGYVVKKDSAYTRIRVNDHIFFFFMCGKSTVRFIWFYYLLFHFCVLFDILLFIV